MSLPGIPNHNKRVTWPCKYLKQGSLSDIVRIDGPLSEETTRDYTRQILNALVYLHEERVIHRDVKGRTIFMIKGITR